MPEFREQIEERIGKRLPTGCEHPLDFAKKILGDLGLHEAIGPDQLEQADEEADEEEEEDEDFAGDGDFSRPAKRIRRFPHLYSSTRWTAAQHALRW